MSTAQQNFAAENLEVSAPLSPSQAINQGDIVKVSSNLIVPISGATDVPHGVAGGTNPVSSIGDTLSSMIVYRKGLFYFFLKASDTANYDDALYLTAAPQTLTTSSAGSAVKVARCRELAAVTGAASDVTRILVEIDLDSI